MSRTIYGACLLALTIGGGLSIGGCGTTSGQSIPSGLTPVSGVVTMGDKPLVGATVTFIPAQSGANASGASGITDSSGKYVLKSYEGGGNGLAPGAYKVVISCLVKADGSVVIPGPDESPMQLLVGGAKETLPDQYSNLLGTKLLATVDASGAPIDFKLAAK